MEKNEWKVCLKKIFHSHTLEEVFSEIVWIHSKFIGWEKRESYYNLIN